MRPPKTITAAMLILLAMTEAQADTNDTRYTLSAGAEVTRGEYGGTDTTTTWYLPLSAKIETDRWLFKLTVPWINTTGPSDVVGSGADRVSLTSDAGNNQTEKGMGDVTTTLGYILYDANDWLLDISGKIKWPTADETKALGTGEKDYTTEISLARQWGRLSTYLSAGKKFMGDLPDAPFLNPLTAGLGTSFAMNASNSMGVSYDWRGPVVVNGAQVSEVTGFVSHKFDTHWKLMGYVVKGFADASPAYGAGGVVSYRF